MAKRKIIKPGGQEVNNVLHFAAKVAESLNSSAVEEEKKMKKKTTKTTKEILH